MTRRVALVALGLLACLAGAAPGRPRKSAWESEIRWIEGGTFRPLYQVAPPGPAPSPPPEVRVASFGLAEYPVTHRQYLEFVRSHPEWRRSRVRHLFTEKAYLQDWTGDLSFPEDVADSPVTWVSWFAARAYCQSQGMRLPSQSEWEYVARASEKQRDATRDRKFCERILEWYGRPTPERLPSVRTGFRNVYGVAAMHGLIWEWVEDFNDLLLSGESRGDSSVENSLYCAAGAVGSIDPSNYATYMRLAFRSSLRARYVVQNLGFRCASSRKPGVP